MSITKTKRRERVREVVGKRSLAGAVCAVLTAGGLVAAGHAYLATGEYEHAHAENAKRISELEGELSDVESVQKDTTDSLSKKLKSASASGQAIAQLQNDYRKAADDDAVIKTISDKLDAYNAEGSLGVESPWYLATRAGEKAAWRFTSNYSFSGDSIVVMWVCETEDKHEILAVATAMYDARNDKYSKVSVRMTGVGLSWVEGTKGAAQGKESLDAVVDRLRRNVGGGAPVDEEMAKRLVEGREAAREAAKGGA